MNNFDGTEDIVDDFYDHNLSNYVDFIQIKHLNATDELIKLNVPPEKIVWQLLLHGNERLLNENISLEIENVKEFKDICSTISIDAWERIYDGNGCIAKKKYENDNISWTIRFDCGRSIANKVKIAIKLGLAGVTITNLSNDDVRGKCQCEDDTFADFSLSEEKRKCNYSNFFALNTVYDAIDRSFSEIDRNSKESGNFNSTKTE